MNEENNKLIAYSDFAPDDVKLNIQHYIDSGNDYGLNEYLSTLKFNESWDLLMPVVEKIEAAGFGTSLTYIPGLGHRLAFSSTDNVVAYASRQTLQAAVYDAVVDFIKWHNEHGK